MSFCFFTLIQPKVESDLHFVNGMCIKAIHWNLGEYISCEEKCKAWAK